jgi:hypothetical protein
MPAWPGPENQAMADGDAVAEELLAELLMDDGDGRRIQRVLRRETEVHDDMSADGVEVLRVPFTQEARLFRSGSPEP